MGKTSSSFLLILVLCVASSVLCKGLVTLRLCKIQLHQYCTDIWARTCCLPCKNAGGTPEIRQSDNGSARREPSSPQPACVFSSAGKFVFSHFHFLEEKQIFKTNSLALWPCAVDVGGGLEVYHTDYHGPMGHSPPQPQRPFSASSPAGNFLLSHSF